MDNETQFDFAISYAGEQLHIAKEIDNRLRELGFFVFFAGRNCLNLAGVDGESLFSHIFSEAKQVMVIISEDYKRKDWTRYEWDVIRKRDHANRFIPVRIDGAQMLGLPSNIIYIEFTGDNYANVIDAAVFRLLSYEHTRGITRPNEYERILDAMRNENKGALSQAYQLVKDQRQRPLRGDYPVPDDGTPSYKVIQREWCNFSVVKRLSVKMLVPCGLGTDAIRFNLKYCAASYFNATKPDAVMVLAYFDEGPNTDIEASFFTAGRAILAPFGKWEKAQDGVAYNLPTSAFEFTVDFA